MSTVFARQSDDMWIRISDWERFVRIIRTTEINPDRLDMDSIFGYIVSAITPYIPNPEGFS